MKPVTPFVQDIQKFSQLWLQKVMSRNEGKAKKMPFKAVDGPKRWTSIKSWILGRKSNEWKRKGGKQQTNPEKASDSSKDEGVTQNGQLNFCSGLPTSPTLTAPSTKLNSFLVISLIASFLSTSCFSQTTWWEIYPSQAFALRAKRVIGGTIKMFWAASCGKLQVAAISIQSFGPKWARQPSWRLRGRVNKHTFHITEPWSNNRQQVIKIIKVFCPIFGGQIKGNTPL